MIKLFKQFRYRYLVAQITISKEWTTPDFRKTPSTTDLEEEDIVDAPGNDGNASTPEQVKPPNPWGKMMMMIMSVDESTDYSSKSVQLFRNTKQ